MHALALHVPLPHLGYRYGRGAHPRTLAAERLPGRQPTTTVRPYITTAESVFVAAERRLFRLRMTRGR